MRFTFLIGYSLLSFQLSAQIIFSNTNLKHTNRSIMYLGVLNTIEISGLNSFGSTELKSVGAEIHKERYNRYVLIPNSTQADTLRLYQQDKLIAEKVFECKLISEPVAQLGYITTKEAALNQILDEPKLNVVFANCDYKMYFHIQHFDISIYNQKNELLGNYFVSGDELNEQSKHEIKKLKPGCKLLFKNVFCISPDSVSRHLSDFEILIK